MRSLLALLLIASWNAFGADSAADLDARVQKMDASTLCVELGRQMRLPPEKRGALYERMSKRATEGRWVEPEDLPLIAKREPRVGMHFCAAVAALGKTDSSSRTQTGSGDSWHLVYRSGQLRLLIEDNRVASIYRS